MGDGWRARTTTHAEELGTTWADLRVGSETARLTDVLLTWPGERLAFEGAPGAWLMHARPDLARMREEATGLADAYTADGVRVHWLQPPVPLLWYPETQVVARIWTSSRKMVLLEPAPGTWLLWVYAGLYASVIVHAVEAYCASSKQKPGWLSALAVPTGAA